MDPVVLLLLTMLCACALGIWYFSTTATTTTTTTITTPAQTATSIGAEVIEHRREEEPEGAVGDHPPHNNNTDAATVGGGRLQRRRLEKERAKEERREQLAAVSEHRRHAAEESERRDEQRRALEARVEALEEDTLEQLRGEARRQQEGVDRAWAETIEVEREGKLGSAEQQDASVEKQLLASIAKDRVVCLDDFCRSFASAQVGTEGQEELVVAESRPTVERVVKVIETLKAQGRLNGVFDDRGKFISITDAECSDIARFIRQHKGRVTREELVKECNRLLSN